MSVYSARNTLITHPKCTEDDAAEYGGRLAFRIFKITGLLLDWHPKHMFYDGLRIGYKLQRYPHHRPDTHGIYAERMCYKCEKGVLAAAKINTRQEYEDFLEGTKECAFRYCELWCDGEPFKLNYDPSDIRAKKLLNYFLSNEQAKELEQRDYISIQSKLFYGRTYLIPVRAGERIKVVENGKIIQTLCVISTIEMPSSDVLLMRKFMIEANEERFLKVAGI